MKTAAETKRRGTVQRLRIGIKSLEAQGVDITARAIEKETGLTFRTIQRNEESYDLFRHHSVYLQSKRAVPKRRGEEQCKEQGPKLQRDPLMAYSKKELVTRLRRLETRVAEVEEAFTRRSLHEQELLQKNLILQAQLTVTDKQLRQIVAEHVNRLH